MTINHSFGIQSSLMVLRTLYVLVISSLVVANSARGEIKTDYLMDSDPSIPVIPKVKLFQLDHAGLWLKALERPECEFQRKAAESIADGNAKGIPNLQTTIPALERILISQASQPVARLATARALISLESRTSSEKLFAASTEFGSDLRELVEPALAAWNYSGIKPVWIQRLNTPKVRTHDLILAIRGLGRVREPLAIPKLLDIAMDLVRLPEVRLEAATAAGWIAESGLEVDASRLVKETRATRVVNRLIAARLLANHGSEAARQLLVQLATDDEPSVAAKGLERLNQIDPALVIPLADRSLKNLDVLVREQAAQAYLKLPTLERIEKLAILLDDPHPGLRRHVCEQFSKLAQKPEFGETIRQLAIEVMARDSWRGQEQAALLVGQLEYLPATRRLVELLESKRVEVAVTAAWSLRRIADLQTIPKICDKIRRQSEVRKVDPKTPGLDEQVAHLFEACGKMRASEAETLMREYLPKTAFGPFGRSRSGAVWALGRLHEGKLDKGLAEILLKIFSDTSPFPAESGFVKDLSIVAIARMNATEYGPELKQAAMQNQLNLRLRWAVMQLTGEELSLPDPQTIGPRPSFLDPLDPIRSVAQPGSSDPTTNP